MSQNPLTDRTLVQPNRDVLREKFECLFGAIESIPDGYWRAAAKKLNTNDVKRQLSEPVPKVDHSKLIRVIRGTEKTGFTDNVERRTLYAVVCRLQIVGEFDPPLLLDDVCRPAIKRAKEIRSQEIAKRAKAAMEGEQDLEKEIDEANNQDAPLSGGRSASTLPFPRNKFFTGREDVLAAIERELSLTKIAALQGLGGMGKTETVVEYAYRNEAQYSRMLWMSCESSNSIDIGFINAFTSLWPTASAPDPQRVKREVSRWLGENEGWLLILDNADSPTLLVNTLPTDASGHILITPRASSLRCLQVDRPIALTALSSFNRNGRFVVC